MPELRGANGSSPLLIGRLISNLEKEKDNDNADK